MRKMQQATMGMGVRRNRRGGLQVLIVVFISISVIFFFDSCRLLRTYPDCSLKEYEFFKSPQQQQTASRVLTSGLSLASQQSYGFFDDIADESWKLMQQRAWSSLHVIGEALPEIRHSNNDEDTTVVSSYLNNLQVSVV
jgi:hypothetical protein